jgi:hypothetical protein
MSAMPTVFNPGINTGSGQKANNPNTAIQSGYNNALMNLQQAMNSQNQTYGVAQNQAQQQLQQNQGKVQQGLINSGLGNTTVAQTMQQAPLQTYNNALANLASGQAGAESKIYGQAAGMQAQEGGALASLLQGQNLQTQQLQNSPAAMQQQKQQQAVSAARQWNPLGNP